MSRVTADDVRLICNTALEDEQIEAVIADASTWVDVNLVGKCDGQTDESLAAAEKYLAAHFLQAQEPVATRTKVGPIEEQLKDGAVDYLARAYAFDPCNIIKRAFCSTGVAAFRVGRGYASEVAR